jgi:hypothetical protein
MTNPFPEPHPIDWDALEEGDRVLLEGVVTLLDARPEKQKRINIGAMSISEYSGPITVRGHVIKAPKPIAVGDPVRADGLAGTYKIVCMDDGKAWLKSSNPQKYPTHETAHVSLLKRIEP